MTSTAVNALCQAVSRRLCTPFQTTLFVLQQVDQGATVPFLARYRRDETGNMEEAVIRRVIDTAVETKELERRRGFMLQSLEQRNLLTPSLRSQFLKISTLDHLEDAWECYKVRTTSLASRGRDHGLSAEALLRSTTQLPQLQHTLKRIKEGEKLLVAVLTEEITRNTILREEMHKYVERTAIMSVTLAKAQRKNAAKAVREEQFEKLQKMLSHYDGRSWSLKAMKSHVYLAIQRGEAKGVLRVHMSCGPQAEAIFRRICREQFPLALERIHRFSNSFESKLVEKGLKSSMDYLTSASYKAVRRDTKKRVEEEAIDVFSSNLRHLLLQQPLKQARILAMDPGLTNGVKCVVLDFDGNVQTTFKCSVLDEERMMKQVEEVVEAFRVNKVIIGNGTASQRTAKIIAKTIQQNIRWPKGSVEFAIVSEAGASVFSVSEAGNEELPDLDILFRGAVSIGRRVLDPLSELVKIPVKSMGIGMYQHDVNEKKLTKALNDTVESCVATVGVNAEVATKYIMEKVPGITKSVVRQILLARHAKKLENRDDLRRVPGMKEEVYTQIVGFFRFPNSTEPLDNTVLLPEWYEYVGRLWGLSQQAVNGNLEKLDTAALNSNPPNTNGEGIQEGTSTMNFSVHATHLDAGLLAKLGMWLQGQNDLSLKKLAASIGCGIECLRLIQAELVNPGMDPRVSLPHAGLMRTELLKTTELKKGDILRGVVQSVTTFGAFVDCGLDQDILLKGFTIGSAFPGMLIEDIVFLGLDNVGRPLVECRPKEISTNASDTPLHGADDQKQGLARSQNGVSSLLGGKRTFSQINDGDLEKSVEEMPLKTRLRTELN